MRHVIVIAVLFLSLATNALPDDLADARKGINAGNQQWIDGWRKNDAAHVAAIFAEDGVWLLPGGKVAKGREAIARTLRGWMDSVPDDVAIEVNTTHLWLDGDTAWESGTYLYSYSDNGQQKRDEGRYVAAWKRDNSGWKLVMDMGVPQD